MSLPIKKIYIDSRWKTDGSVSDSDFTVELKSSVNLPRNCIAYVDDVCVAHSWYNVDATNFILYIYANRGTNHDYFTLYIDHGNYNGNTLKKDNLNLKFTQHMGDYMMEALYDVNRNYIIIKTR